MNTEPPDRVTPPIDHHQFLRADWDDLETAFATYSLLCDGEDMLRVESDGRVAIAVRYWLPGHFGRRFFVRAQQHPQWFEFWHYGERDEDGLVLYAARALPALRTGRSLNSCLFSLFLGECFRECGAPVLFR